MFKSYFLDKITSTKTYSDNRRQLNMFSNIFQKILDPFYYEFCEYILIFIFHLGMSRYCFTKVIKSIKDLKPEFLNLSEWSTYILLIIKSLPEFNTNINTLNKNLIKLSNSLMFASTYSNIRTEFNFHY